MQKHLRTLVKECRHLLEQDLRSRFHEAGFPSVKEAALACFIELAAIRCFEEQRWKIPSSAYSELDREQQRQKFFDDCRRLQSDLSFLAQQQQVRSPVPSSQTLKVISQHLTRRISPEEWRSEHLLGWLYQCFDDDTPEQKQEGRFYTPEPIAEYVVNQTLTSRLSGTSAAETAALSVLDLACGAGVFALKAFEALYRRHQEAGQNGAFAQQILEDQLFLVDRDPWACRVAALNLYLKAKSLDPECTPGSMNIFCADALRRWEHDGNVELKKLFTKRFDLVLGNPPYIVVNQLKVKKEEIRQYKSYASAAFKINTFALFIERGLGLLKPSGTLGMIVPNTLLTQVYFEPLRKYILSTSRIRKIFDTKRMFENAFVENCIILLQREENAEMRRRTFIECLLKEQAGTALQEGSTSPGSCERNVRIPQHHFEKAPFMMFNVHLDEGTFALLEKIANGHPTLSEICESHDGVNPGNARHKLLLTEKLDEHCRKVLNGKNIGRYRLKWGGLYVRYDRRALAKGDNVRWGHRATLDAAKILTRQTADRIIGSFDAGRYYVTNSIHTTILRSGAQNEFSLKYVLALLNSKVLSFYYRKLISEVGQLFCQVKLVHLRQLPLRRIALEEQQCFIEDVETLLILGDQQQETAEANSQEALQKQMKDINERLDQKVYALYELDTEEISVIEKEFPPA